MEDDTSSSLDGKVVGNLRVVDLKHELEKRGLSKSGSKKDLVKRLKTQLEFEKLCEERKSAGDYDLKSELDAATEQNEFVQQYLAQQQKRYAERKEKERLELEAFKKVGEENSKANDIDNLTSEAASRSDEEINENEEYPQSNVLDKAEVSHDANNHSLESKDKETSNTSKVTKEDEEDNLSCLEETQSKDIGPNISSSSPNQNQSEYDNKENNQRKNTNNLTIHSVKIESELGDLYAHDTSERIEREMHGDKISSESFKGIDKKNNKTGIFEDLHSKIRCLPILAREKENKVVADLEHNSNITEMPICAELQKSVSDASELQIQPSCSEKSSSRLSCLQNISHMDSSQCQSVPYSLSDIQLPESPGSHSSKHSKPVKSEESKHISDSAATDTEQNIHTDNKVQSNGMSVCDNINSSQDVSDSETRLNNESDESPRKKPVKKECNSVVKEQKDSRSESTDKESDTNCGSDDKKIKHEDIQSNLVMDSEEQTKNISGKEKMPLKSHQESEESDNEKSSDSEKYKHRRIDSKHKSHDKHRKRSRRSHSASSSSSSSDSSPKHRRSKKSSVTKSKSFVESIENNKKSTGEHSKHENNEKTKHSVSESSISSKKRLKIKRDNVAVETSSSVIESATENSVSRKSIEEEASSSCSTSSKLLTQESTEPKEKEISYVPRKVSLSNRKLNRKSSEDKSTEPKSKKNKWDSFASAQKTSQTISISTDSLKNWFPDFKLISEPAAATELEHDETSLSMAEEKSTNVIQADAADESNSDVKHDSFSRMEVEETEPQEAEFEVPAEQGPVSKIIFIQNLVRPFTLNQLKELLKQYGKTVEEYFWIDKIKSKCFVMYETEREAYKARNALNNSRWPSSNPKILSVEFSNEDELESYKLGNDVPSKPVVEKPVIEPQEIAESRTGRPVEEHKRKERERERRKDRERSKPQPPIREWDKDKIVQDSPERERMPKEEKSRSSEKKEKKESKKRANEDTPAKLLDDLFQKTKSAPCIYWLPLTEEQAKQREEKRSRELEREKRNQQSKEQEAEHRNRGARSSRRSREKENRKSSTRSRSPVTRRR